MFSEQKPPLFKDLNSGHCSSPHGSLMPAPRCYVVIKSLWQSWPWLIVLGTSGSPGHWSQSGALVTVLGTGQFWAFVTVRGTGHSPGHSWQAWPTCTHPKMSQKYEHLLLFHGNFVFISGPVLAYVLREPVCSSLHGTSRSRSTLSCLSHPPFPILPPSSSCFLLPSLVFFSG